MTSFHKSSARPRQSKPAPRLALVAGARTTIDDTNRSVRREAGGPGQLLVDVLREDVDLHRVIGRRATDVEADRRRAAGIGLDSPRRGPTFLGGAVVHGS